MAQAAPSAGDGPVLPMLFQKGPTALRLFTTIATLGTPRDVTLQELRVESFFPDGRRDPRRLSPVGYFFRFARSIASAMRRWASATPPQPESFTHLPGSRSL